MDKACIWLADEAHQSEVAKSMESVRAVMPDLPVINQVIVRHSPFWYADWICALIDALDLPYDRIVFFDSDVYAVEPFDDIFAVLEHYDLTSTHAPARQTTDMPFIMPDAFCEFNTGVMGFRNNATIESFFCKWYQTLLEHVDVTGDNDQAPLRIALWDSPDVRVWVMPPEYNCRFGFGGFAAGQVKLLHGRSSTINAIGKHINLNAQMRTWERGFYK
jgi:hypothetical protein